MVVATVLMLAVAVAVTLLRAWSIDESYREARAGAGPVARSRPVGGPSGLRGDRHLAHPC